jgi:hypothetical protein
MLFMAHHPSTPAGPRAWPGAEPAPGQVRPPHRRTSLEALILSILYQMLARLLGEPAAGGRETGHARLAPLMALWAALPTRRLTRRTRDQEDSVRHLAAQAAALRAIRRLAARAGWIINGCRNRGMRPAAPHHAPPRRAPARDPPA